jgi:predicted ATPase
MGGGQTSLILGRDGDMARLWSAYLGARTSGPRVVLISGEAGVGKSRLSHEFAVQLSSEPKDGGVIVTAHAVDLAGGAIPYAVVGVLIDGLVAELGMPGVLEVLGPGAQALAPIVSSFGEPTENTPIDRLKLFLTLGRLITELSSARPVTLIVEDLHWCDQASLDVLQYLARTITTGHLLLIMTLRLEPVAMAQNPSVAELARSVEADRIELNGLPIDAVAELMKTRRGLGFVKRRSPRCID